MNTYIKYKFLELILKSYINTNTYIYLKSKKYQIIRGVELYIEFEKLQ